MYSMLLLGTGTGTRYWVHVVHSLSWELGGVEVGRLCFVVDFQLINWWTLLRRWLMKGACGSTLKKKKEWKREEKKRTRYYLLNNFRTCDRPLAL